MITVYTTPSCQQCRITKLHLDRTQAEYELADLTQDTDAYYFITEELGHQQAPVVTITTAKGDLIDHWSGYQPDKINQHTKENHNV